MGEEKEIEWGAGCHMMFTVVERSSGGIVYEKRRRKGVGEVGGRKVEKTVIDSCVEWKMSE